MKLNSTPINLNLTPDQISRLSDIHSSGTSGEARKRPPRRTPNVRRTVIVAHRLQLGHARGA
jgi:hypothetical protein